MLVYVNKVYIQEDFISYIQIMMHDEVNLKNVYYTDEYSKVVSYCRDLRAKGHKVLPFRDNLFLV